jgi:protein SCO1
MNLRTLVLGFLLTMALVASSLGVRRPAPEPADGAATCCTDDPAGGAGDCFIETDQPDRTDAPIPDLPAPADTVDLSRPLDVPDTPLVDQRGRPVQFYSDLVKGRLVAINFIFTTCVGICPPMGATFGKLEKALQDQGVQLISVSVDPVNDTPERLAAWAKKFGAGADWRLVTGAKQDVDGLLRSLGVFSADKTNHSPLILLGNDRTGTWRRIHGLSPIETIKNAIDAIRDAPEREPAEVHSDSSRASPPAHRYFTDVALENQHGESMRLYSDLLRSKVVVIHVFFASCKNTCPLMMATIQKLQDHLGDRLGRDVNLISLTVDPDHDDRKVLEDFARRLGARRGWYLLSGPKQNLETALGKLGMAVASREEHSNIFLIGNEQTQLWKKVRGLAPADQIIEILDGVIADQAEPSRSGPASIPEPGD